MTASFALDVPLQRIALNSREDLAGLTDGHVFGEQAGSELTEWCVISKQNAAGYIMAISRQKTKVGELSVIRQALINLTLVTIASPNAVFLPNTIVNERNYYSNDRAVAKEYKSYRKVLDKVAKL
jgi:hypothetical protein